MTAATARVTLRRAALPGVPESLAVLAFAGWAALTIALWQGLLAVPRAGQLYQLLLYGVPLGTVAVLVFGRTAPPRWLTLFAAAVGLTAGGIVGSGYAIRGPLFVAGIVCVLGSALASRRWPSGFLILMFGLSGTYGSVTAFTAISPGQVVDLLLAGLWLGALFALVVRRRDYRHVLTPGVVLAAIFLAASLIAVLFAPNQYVGMRSFRATGWHMLTFLVIAYGGWTRVNLQRVARVVVVVCALVGGYAVLRWLIGPAAREQELVETAGNVTYNQVAGDRKVQGSLPSGHQLGTWCAVAIPFCVAAAVTWRNWARGAAMVAVPLLAIGLLASANRAGLAGAVGGTVVVLVLNQLARSFEGPRLGIALAAVLSLGLAAFLIFPVVIDDPSKVERYRNILTPTRDKSFQERLFKWENALADIDDHPFGRGMGSAGADSNSLRFRGLASDNVDNAYMQIAYEQGFAMMVLFFVTMLVLLAGLARRAVWHRQAEPAAIAIGASGALAAFLVTLFVGQYLHALLAVGLWVIVGLGLAPFTTIGRDEK